MVPFLKRDSRPIYEQIVEEFRKQIVSGALRADEKLPSVRELSVALSINLNTIQRAYRELEAGGYIYSIPGKGSYAQARENVGSERKRELTEKLVEITAELKYLGMDEKSIINAIYGGKEND